ncbi:MAG: FMN-binding negative transcriptional regulator [Rubrivivax sp.]
MDGEPVVNHVPFRLDPTRGEHGTLVGHVARANPVWQRPGPSVLVFQGADGYVSPSWYPTKREHGKVVPTWNYAVVHAHGVPRIVDDAPGLLAIVGSLTDTHEAARAAPWKVSDAPDDYVAQMLRAIVGIEIPVQRWVGKFKLSQNHAEPNRTGVLQGLREHDAQHPLAALMQEHAPR